MTDYFVWSIDPIIFSIGSFGIRWYSLMFATGFIAGFYIMRDVFKHENKPEEKLDSLLIHLVLGTVIGARLGHVLFYEPGYYLSNPLEIIKIWEGGLASHGGAMGVLISLFLFVRKHQFSYLWLLDRLVIPIALTTSLIRLGNFFNSEILGNKSDLPWAIIFSRIDQIPRHPVQLYESMAYLAIFALLFFVYRKQQRKPAAGLLFGSYLIIAFSARIFLESFKTKQASFDAPLAMSMGQWLSVPFILAGIFLLVKALKKT
ncbi:MAG: prolipoprotein diacylglyceryl transferase [Gammaproteobacteria bacterium]|nr:prolipoprotein diacylglyceryl transferase [Gammaproteobacteria bacterium]